MMGDILENIVLTDIVLKDEYELDSMKYDGFEVIKNSSDYKILVKFEPEHSVFYAIDISKTIKQQYGENKLYIVLEEYADGIVEVFIGNTFELYNQSFYLKSKSKEQEKDKIENFIKHISAIMENLIGEKGSVIFFYLSEREEHLERMKKCIKSDLEVKSKKDFENVLISTRLRHEELYKKLIYLGPFIMALLLYYMIDLYSSKNIQNNLLALDRQINNLKKEQSTLNATVLKNKKKNSDLAKRSLKIDGKSIYYSNRGKS